jgi:hypothetical protein
MSTTLPFWSANQKLAVLIDQREVCAFTGGSVSDLISIGRASIPADRVTLSPIRTNPRSKHEIHEIFTSECVPI